MDDCSLKLCPKGKASVDSKPEECSGRGECYNGTCKCMPQYHGPGCELTCLSAKPGAVCSGHGDCKVVKDTRSLAYKLKESRCFCMGGYTGHECNQRTCPDDCSGNGYCSSFTGTCMCKPTYVGKA